MEGVGAVGADVWEADDVGRAFVRGGGAQRGGGRRAAYVADHNGER